MTRPGTQSSSVPFERRLITHGSVKAGGHGGRSRAPGPGRRRPTGRRTRPTGAQVPSAEPQAVERAASSPARRPVGVGWVPASGQSSSRLNPRAAASRHGPTNWTTVHLIARGVSGGLASMRDRSTGGVVTGGEQRELAETFASIAGQLLGTGTVEQTLQRIVSLAVVTIDGCEHAGVALLVDGQLETAAQSDEIPAILAEIQNRTGEGPCVEAAFQRHDVYDSGDLSSDPRWPRFTAEAGERTDIRSALGTSLRVGDEVVGALDLYATATDAFDDDARSMAAIFAAHAAMGLAGAKRREQLHRAIETRDLIGRAKGIIMVRSGVDEDTAFALLRDASSRTHRRLRDVARQVVEGELEP